MIFGGPTPPGTVCRRAFYRRIQEKRDGYSGGHPPCALWESDAAAAAGTAQPGGGAGGESGTVKAPHDAPCSEKGGAGKGTAPEQQGNKGCGPAGKKAGAEQWSEEAVHPDLLFGRPE